MVSIKGQHSLHPKLRQSLYGKIEVSVHSDWLINRKPFLFLYTLNIRGDEIHCHFEDFWQSYMWIQISLYGEPCMAYGAQKMYGLSRKCLALLNPKSPYASINSTFSKIIMVFKDLVNIFYLFHYQDKFCFLCKYSHTSFYSGSSSKAFNSVNNFGIWLCNHLRPEFLKMIKIKFWLKQVVGIK